MYYSKYDPTIHDVYLYGPGNVGYPIGLNPNSLIYGASGDFRSILPRQRAFTGTGPVPIPPTAGVTSFPNYYNIKDSPIYVVIGEETVSGNIHYTANKSSDSILNTAKYTGTTTGYPINTLSFWNNNFSGLCSYGPWTGIYNYVPLNGISGATGYATPRYFNGSPEIPGFESGATYYQILPIDYGFMDLINAGITLSQPKAKKIGVSALIKEFTDHGLTLDYTKLSNNIFQVTCTAQNLYIWDGNDKVIPIPAIQVSYYDYILNNIHFTQPLGLQNIFSNSITGATYNLWVGDSSSQIIYKKNNSLYFLGSIESVGGLPPNNSIALGPLYYGDSLPLYNFLTERLVEPNHYWYALNQGLTLATQIDFTRLETAINNLSSKINNLYQEWNDT
jgi:hypothetical protein